MVVINILLSTSLVIAPVKVGGYENEALHNLEEQVENLREFNPEIRIKGIMTMRQKNKTSLEFEEWLREASGFDMFITPVRRSIVVEKATIGMTVLPKFSRNGIVLRVCQICLSLKLNHLTAKSTRCGLHYLFHAYPSISSSNSFTMPR